MRQSDQKLEANEELQDLPISLAQCITFHSSICCVIGFYATELIPTSLNLFLQQIQVSKL